MKPVTATPEQLLFCHFDGDVPDLSAVEWWVVTAPAPSERTPPAFERLGYWYPYLPGAIHPVDPDSSRRSLLDGAEIDNNWLTVTQVPTFEAALALRAKVRDEWNYHPEQES